MGAMQRRKGKVAEREAAEFIRTAWGVNARRSVQFSGKNGDADLTTDLTALHFEVKARQSHSVFKFLDQAKQDGGDKVSVVLLRENGRKRWGILVFADEARAFAKALETTCQSRQSTE